MKARSTLTKPAISPRNRTWQATSVANDRGEFLHVGALLVSIVDSAALRRDLGFDGWAQAFIAFLANLKSCGGGGCVSQFGWDTACLIFDGVTEIEFHRSFDSLSVLADASAAPGTPRLGFDFLIGGALGKDEINILERAEQALENARLRGRSTLATDKIASQGVGNLDLATDLALAVQRNELFVVYQPKVHVRRRAIFSAEALIRWQHPILGLVMPDSFIALADSSGEIRAITLWTLRRVIDDQQQLAAEGHALRVFINISGALLTDRVFIDAACALVAEFDADIGFEITETSVIQDPDLAIANLTRCADMGIVLAIDDYGSGLSSLSYLKRLPVSELKIDKMFITQLTSSHRDPLIVRSTIDLAHALGMEVTAEGVETPAALALLSVMGCEMVQGYLISPPLAFAAFQSYLSDYRFETLQISAAPTIHRPASFWKRA